MSHSQSLDKTFDKVIDMKTLQTKNCTSSNAYLSKLDKTKTRNNSQKKTFSLWLGFKAMNA